MATDPEQQAQSSHASSSNDQIVVKIWGELESDPAGTAAAGGEESKPTIFRVSNRWKLSEEFFRPQIVSIGPYARDNDGGHINNELQRMEDVKKQFLRDLLTKTSDPKAFLNDCVQNLSDEVKIKSHYQKPLPKMQSGVFVEMMLLDAIFIIEFFMKCKRGDIRSMSDIQYWNLGMIMHDLLLLENQIPFFVLQHLFVLFLTHAKSDDTGDNKELKLLFEILDGFRKQGELTEIEWGLIEEKTEIKHLLHLYHGWYTNQQLIPARTPIGLTLSGQFSAAMPLPIYSLYFFWSPMFISEILVFLVLSLISLLTEFYRVVTEQGIIFYLKELYRVITDRERLTEFYRGLPSRFHLVSSDFHSPRDLTPTKKERLRILPPATKLYELGVNFKKKDRSTNSLDVTFNKNNGDLEIPPFSVDDKMMSKFVNLISLEQSAEDVPHEIIGYAAFMDNIIQTPKDVEILRHEGILVNSLNDVEVVKDEEIVKDAFFFNKLCSYSHLNVEKKEDYYFDRLLEDVDAFRKSYWRRNKALLVREYLSNIWVFIGVMSAAVLLFLTFVRSFFAVLAYFRPPSKS